MFRLGDTAVTLHSGPQRPSDPPGISRQHPSQESNVLRKLWQEWLILARHIGSFNARALITLVYFTLMAPFGLVIHLFSDPLHLKQPQTDDFWHQRETYDVDLERARRQG